MTQLALSHHFLCHRVPGSGAPAAPPMAPPPCAGSALGGETASSEPHWKANPTPPVDQRRRPRQPHWGASQGAPGQSPAREPPVLPGSGTSPEVSRQSSGDSEGPQGAGHTAGNPASKQNTRKPRAPLKGQRFDDTLGSPLASSPTGHSRLVGCGSQPPGLVCPNCSPWHKPCAESRGCGLPTERLVPREPRGEKGQGFPAQWDPFSQMGHESHLGSAWGEGAGRSACMCVSKGRHFGCGESMRTCETEEVLQSAGETARQAEASAMEERKTERLLLFL